jgi:hypothetical protein
LKRITLANFSHPFSLWLEHWIKHPHLQWQWFYRQCECHLYHHTNGKWHHYVPFSACSTVAFKWIGIGYQGGRKPGHIKMTLFGLYFICHQPHLSIFESFWFDSHKFEIKRVIWKGSWTQNQVVSMTLH